MGIVVEVISQLEIYSITKEALEVIRAPLKRRQSWLNKDQKPKLPQMNYF